ncbi:SDR family oxidoreductase [Burkholderia multivorans]|uniref:SDR family NAD(P)-dependent oxidoreductase n=1 Tax=Burkholderia multivorans TaxID=87883 RepID=UPI000CFE382E|nr:SDR family NAD(P)-dependent oxidoreductase [Burkholderia multivorans]AYZ01396.1 SDR family oxidoreductase [Burkholderia multivorans]MBU9119969.1 SDR family oxidoreductase [Burkholderia multivorans]MBU9232786.1 SDR family oxidoreductase [Burkholderia multivorans]MBU9547614.1 SDR family oxidoreductase [Burkholderia multivorans]PRG53524.1 short-chain dehydrogenase [Burkholderia multivorans]
MSEVVVVTGSSQGVGKGIASVYLREGAIVVGCDRRPPHEDLASNENFSHVDVDLTQDGAAAKVIAVCIERHGRLDSLVNNAGLGNAKPFEQTSSADYQRYYDINVGSLLALCGSALPHLKASRGSIVNIASAFGLVGVAQAAAYVPTKYAVVGMTRMLATEFGCHGVRVNAVAPGLVRSPGTEQRIASNPWWHKMMIEGAPLGRVGEPEEIGHACRFLSSPQASFITGVVLPVDGGWSIAKFLPDPSAG